MGYVNCDELGKEKALGWMTLEATDSEINPHREQQTFKMPRTRLIVACKLQKL